MMDKELQKLIAWKTNAWKNKEMAAWYAKQMTLNTSTIQLKNAVEVTLCEQFAVGTKILDVGIGTGRASLPLLNKGFSITGIDSSQAMLDECKILAGNHPIQLQLGDVCSLPFVDDHFDSLMSLNVMTHFPHWREVLSEWQRVVKPGGRIIFDIYSLDHLCFVDNRKITIKDLLEQNPITFNMHIAVEELFEYADKADLNIVSIVPYGSVFSGQIKRFNSKTPLNKLHWWQRHLSWLAVDEALFNAVLFLELNFFASLTSKTTGRFMVILENRPDPEANSQIKQRLSKINQLLSDELTLETLAPYLPIPLDEWKQQFLHHMMPLRNRAIAYLLLTSFLGQPDKLNLISFFGEEMGEELNTWLKQEISAWSSHQNIMEFSQLLAKSPDTSKIPANICLEHEFRQAVEKSFETKNA